MLVPDHHPAIFTLEEHEKLCDILDANKRTANLPGQKHRAKMCMCSPASFIAENVVINWFPLPADCRQIISALPLTHARKRGKRTSVIIHL